MFHKNVKGKFLGYLFPSGFKILGVNSTEVPSGEFFFENRNFLCSRYRFLGVTLLIKHIVLKVNNYELILITKLYVDEKGKMKLQFHRYLSDKVSKDNLNLLKKKGKIRNYFSKLVSAPISSLNITYMNSLENLTCHKEGFQMSEKGPDSYMINYGKVENHIGLKWNQKSTCQFLPVKRKDTRNTLPRRLRNSIGTTMVYIIPASEIEHSYVHDSDTKLFLIP